MLIIQCLGLIILFLGGAVWSVQAGVIVNMPEAVNNVFREAVLDLALRYGTNEPCNWEEHEANINAVYDELSLKAPQNANQWIDQLCSLAKEISRSMFDSQTVHIPLDLQDNSFIRFCCMLGGSMLFQINYENYIKRFKEHVQRSALLEQHRENCFATLEQINGHLEYNQFVEKLTSYYYSIYEEKIPNTPVYYFQYEDLNSFTIKFMLQILVKGYFHWNIVEQCTATGEWFEHFGSDSDQRFEEDSDLQGQDDLHQIGMKRGKLISCYKTCKILKMVAQDHTFEQKILDNINGKIKDFDSVGFCYSPIVLAGLVASSVESANFLASCVLQNFGKMHSHFIYLIFSNPFTCIQQEALLAFAQHFMEEIVKEQVNGWQNQKAEIDAWGKILR